MAKRGGGLRRQLAKIEAPSQSLEQQIQGLITQKKYVAALQTLQQGLAQNPDQTLTVSEADILLLQGKDDVIKFKHSQAQKALSKALELGLYKDTYYWLAKSLLAQHKATEALELLQTAFGDKTLPKDLGGCYLKLLVLNDKMDVVEALIETQTKRFLMPHIHWARGAVALKSNRPKDALPHFKKAGRPASPDDRLMLWTAFAYQQAGEWAQAANALPMISPSYYGPRFQSSASKHPAQQQMILLQTAHSDRAPSEFFDIDEPTLPERNAAWVLEFLDFIREEDYHEAAHLVLKFPAGALVEYRDLKALRHPLMLLAGEQSRQQQEIDCTATFWSEALADTTEATFDPNLALNLYQALRAVRSHRKAIKLLTQLITWVKKTAQQNEQAWPPPRLNSILVKLLCWSTDSHASLGQHTDVMRILKQVEKIDPNHPEVIARRGLEAFHTRTARNKSPQKAIELLTQALEAGSDFAEAYETLLEALADDAEATKAIRRKFGKRFGDGGVDTEVEMPDWIEALTFESYGVLTETVRDAKKPSAPLKALKIFLEAADDEPSSSQKITLNLEKAVPKWEALLAAHSPAVQVEIIKAVYFGVQQHAKRNKKGIARLQGDYFAKIIELSSQPVPGAVVAHLMLLAVRSLPPERLTIAVAAALGRTAQPANTLASAQLELRRFVNNTTLRPFIQAQLKKEPQNPQLLLAQATLHDRKSREYSTFYDQGFEIARRLQDAAALQAFREEDWLARQEMTRRAIGPQLNRLGDPSQLDPLDMLDIMKRMAREAFGGDVPPEILAQMIPELLGGMGEDFEDDDDFDGMNFFSPPPRRKVKKAPKRPKFGFLP